MRWPFKRAEEHLHFFYNDGSGWLTCRCGDAKHVGPAEARRMLRTRRLESAMRGRAEVRS